MRFLRTSPIPWREDNHGPKIIQLQYDKWLINETLEVVDSQHDGLSFIVLMVSKLNQHIGSG